jgi:hypothetical protein
LDNNLLVLVNNLLLDLANNLLVLVNNPLDFSSWIWSTISSPPGFGQQSPGFGQQPSLLDFSWFWSTTSPWIWPTNLFLDLVNNLHSELLLLDK